MTDRVGFLVVCSFSNAPRPSYPRAPASPISLHCCSPLVSVDSAAAGSLVNEHLQCTSATRAHARFQHRDLQTQNVFRVGETNLYEVCHVGEARRRVAQCEFVHDFYPGNSYKLFFLKEKKRCSVSFGFILRYTLIKSLCGSYEPHLIR